MNSSQSQNETSPLVPVCNNVTSLYLRPVTEREVIGTIDSMRGESAGGHDGIQMKLVKQIKQSISKPLTYIYNSCFKKGTYPESFKLAIVRPVYKKALTTIVP